MYKYEQLEKLDFTFEHRPFYLLNIDKLNENYTKLNDAFSRRYKHFKIAYSYKTNYTPEICKAINRNGGMAEVVSDMELYLAMKIGVPFDKIIYNGPYKGKGQFTLLENSGTVIIDNIEQLKSILIWAEKNPNLIGNIGVRVNYELIPNKISRFGFDVNSPEFAYALNTIGKIHNLHLRGLHCHFSGARGLKEWKTRIDTMLGLVKKFELDKIDFIDLGSGMFGEMNPELAKQFPLQPSFEEYAEVVAGTMSESFASIEEKDKPWLIVEPGTTIVANVMQLVSKVMHIKNIRGKNFIGLNSSIHNAGELSMKKNLPISVVRSSTKSDRVENADFTGYTCLEYDILYRNYTGEISVNDFVVMDNVGSYSVVLKPPFILPQCPIAIVKNDNIVDTTVKRSETFEEVFRTFSI